MLLRASRGFINSFGLTKEYTAVIKECNACHTAVGYAFIKVVKQKSPSDVGVDYKVSSKAEDVPK